MDDLYKTRGPASQAAGQQASFVLLGVSLLADWSSGLSPGAGPALAARRAASHRVGSGRRAQRRPAALDLRRTPPDWGGRRAANGRPGRDVRAVGSAVPTTGRRSRRSGRVGRVARRRTRASPAPEGRLGPLPARPGLVGGAAVAGRAARRWALPCGPLAAVWASGQRARPWAAGLTALCRC